MRGVGQQMSRGTVSFAVVHGDATQADVDVLALKHAQRFHGLDLVVADRLFATGQEVHDLGLPPGHDALFESRLAVDAAFVLFVGTPSLVSFTYSDVRRFAMDVLRALRASGRRVRSVGMSLHGPGFGLDEVEAALAQLGGCVDALWAGDVPPDLEEIRILEIDRQRCERIWSVMDETLGRVVERGLDRRAWTLGVGAPTDRGPRHESVGTVAGVVDKPHAFVAMPFAKEMEDVYYFGIQGPVRGHGLVCERIDQEVFTGDIVEQIKRRIESAAVVIADVTGANPNVYLEIGYAWGRARPCVLLIRDGDEPRFDIRGIRHIKYATIRELAELLDREVGRLREQGLIT